MSTGLRWTIRRDRSAWVLRDPYGRFRWWDYSLRGCYRGYEMKIEEIERDIEAARVKRKEARR